MIIEREGRTKRALNEIKEYMQLIERVGTVDELSINLVKGMTTDDQSRKRDEIEIRKSRVVGDRRVAFYLSNLAKINDFPWVTARILPEVMRYMARLEKPLSPGDSRIIVTTPAGAEFDVMDPKLALEIQAKLRNQNRYRDAEVRAISRASGLQDSMSVSLLSRQTISAVQARIGGELDAQQFRMNILFDAVEQVEGVEDAWLQSAIKMGNRTNSAILTVVEKDTRCVVINQLPGTTDTRPEVLKDVAKNRGGTLGVYAAPLRTGTVRVGDDIYIQRINF